MLMVRIQCDDRIRCQAVCDELARRQLLLCCCLAGLALKGRPWHTSIHSQNSFKSCIPYLSSVSYILYLSRTWLGPHHGDLPFNCHFHHQHHFSKFCVYPIRQKWRYSLYISSVFIRFPGSFLLHTHRYRLLCCTSGPSPTTFTLNSANAVKSSTVYPL